MRGVVELLAGGDQQEKRTRSLAEKAVRLGLFALTVSTLSGCAPPPPRTSDGADRAASHATDRATGHAAS
jgi:hypothetical protein